LYNAIAPTITETTLAGRYFTQRRKKKHDQKTPNEQVFKPTEVANMAHFLISDQAKIYFRTNFLKWITALFLLKSNTINLYRKPETMIKEMKS
jgi:NAD(P)-dependent dehydrogenase (short-subunit alcohol dehydrogenase family)